MLLQEDPAVFIQGICFFINALLYSMMHEYAHAAAVRRTGGKGRMEGRGIFGNVLYLEQGQRVRHRLLIYLAGPAFNLVCAAAGLAFFQSVRGSGRFSELWDFFLTQEWFLLFCREAEQLIRANLMVGFFNLLPFFPLDGGRIAVLLFSQLFPKAAVMEGAWIFSVIFTICAVLFGVFLLKYNIMNVILILDALYFFCIFERERKHEILGSQRIYRS